MNKKDFTAYINKQLEGMPLERQIQELKKIQEKWLLDLIHAKQKKEGTWIEPERKDKYIFCNKCKKYSLIKQCNEDWAKEIRTETTYIDPFYGEGNRTGDVEYSVQYIICPKCGHKQEKQQWKLRVIKEWFSREGRR